MFNNIKLCGFCHVNPEKCLGSMRSIGGSIYQCCKGETIDLDPFLNSSFIKSWKEEMKKVSIYKVEVFIEDYSQQPVPLLGHGILTKDVRLVTDEDQAKEMIQQAKAIAKAMFQPTDGSELEQRFHQDKEHVVEVEYFVDNHQGAIGELFAIYSRI